MTWLSARARGALILITRYIWFAVLILTYAALSLDSYRNPEAFLKMTGIDSGALLLVSLLCTYICVNIYSSIRLPQRITSFIRWIVFPISAIIGVSFTIIAALLPPNVLYGMTRINYQQVFYIAILSGWIIFWHTSKIWKQKHHDMIFFASGWILLGISMLISLWPFYLFVRMSEEDHLVENAQFFVLLVGSVMALRVFKKLFRTHIFIAVLYGLFAIGLFLVAGEEISWGQRLLHLSTPSYFQQYNVQGEINAHNLVNVNFNVTTSYIIIGLWGWAGSFFTKRLKKYAPLFSKYFLAPWYLFPYFYSAFLFNARIYLGPHTIGRWSEMMELMLYLGICLFIIKHTYNEKLTSNC